MPVLLRFFVTLRMICVLLTLPSRRIIRRVWVSGSLTRENKRGCKPLPQHHRISKSDGTKLIFAQLSSRQSVSDEGSQNRPSHYSVLFHRRILQLKKSFVISWKLSCLIDKMLILILILEQSHNPLRIKSLCGKFKNEVMSWQLFWFLHTCVICIDVQLILEQRCNFFMNEQKGGAFFIVAE